MYFVRSSLLPLLGAAIASGKSPYQWPLTNAPAAPVPFYVPFYGTSANGFTGPARGWNSFGIQANTPIWPEAKFDFNQYHIQQQCDVLQATNDYVYCSIDSMWSVGDHGDHHGRIIPDTSKFYDLPGLANHLQRRGIKLGLYILPGAFELDGNRTVFGTNIQIRSLFNNSVDPSGETSNNYSARFNFDYSQDGVQQWHNSVVNLLASWGVDLIKLDYVTPGSPGNNGSLPYDSSGAIWRNNADSLRLDTDINNANNNTFVAWGHVQRAIEQYRSFINQQTEDPTRQGLPIQVRPDMDNLYVGNADSLSGINYKQRYSVAIHWIGAGANLITGSDLTNLDGFGYQFLFNAEALAVADFTSQYPMQPRNPEGWGTPGGGDSMQLQAWIAGPNDNGTAVAVLANYGPDLGQGGFNTNWGGIHNVRISLDDLGIGPNTAIGGKTYSVRRVWGGGGSGGPDHTDIGNTSDGLACNLGEGESALYILTKVA